MFTNASVADLLRRLRKRRVLQWAAAYLAAAWLLYQALSLLAQNFAWPEIYIRVITVIIGVGFLAALVLGWYHGEKGRQRVSGPELLMLAALFLLAGAGIALVGLEGTSADAHLPVDSAIVTMPEVPPEQNSVAVLPFANLAPDHEDDYFSDGLTEELLNALADVPGLRVPARSSSFQYKGRALDVREVGRALGVAHVLEGSVRRFEQRLRVSAELSEVETGYRLWSATYDRDLHDIFTVQEEIARAIVGALNVRFTDGAALVRRYTDNLQAYEFYLRGRFLERRGGEAALLESIEYFERALDVDPGYAVAWSGIADSYTILADTHWPPNDAYPRAREAALRALALDSTLPEARMSLAGVTFWSDWDISAALTELQRALELDPAYARAHWLHGLILATLRRSDEARAAYRRAAQLDPIWERWPEDLAMDLTLVQDLSGLNHDVVTDSLHSLTQAGPADRATSDKLIRAAYLARRYDAFVEYVEEYRPELLQRIDQPGYASSAVAIAYARLGRRAEVEEILARWHERAMDRYVAPHWFAKVYANLGEVDLAFEWLERSIEVRDAYLFVFIDTDPAWDPIRSDPRFQRIRTLVRRS